MVERIKPGTPDGTEENVERIAELFPEVVTEVQDADGNLEHVVDFDALRDLLGDVAEGQRERYQFTWPGKAAAKAEARKPIWKTMRPEPEKSVDWDTTKNLYIEGDNLDALKLLKETYAGQVKLIYIDPPYNTGHDFVYDDDFAQTHEEYDAESGDFDEDGGRLVANPDSNGRFHSDWCSMIYPRLVLARDLLSADGAIFISIDDNELDNLIKIANEVFGAVNHVCTFVVVNNMKGRNDKAHYAPCHEYLVVYGRGQFVSYGIPLSKEKESDYDHEDPNGNKYLLRDLRKRGNGDRREDRPNMFFPIFYSEQTHDCSLEALPGYVEILPKLSDGSDGRWRWGKDTVSANLNLLEPVKRRGGKWGIDYRVYLDPTLNPTSQSKGEERRDKPKSIWLGPEFSSDVAQRDLKDLFNGIAPFDYPKSLALLKRILQIASADDNLVMDFFSGSGGTAQAVFNQNAEDGGTRRFILVQLPEVVSGGWGNLCNVGEERIRRAGKKIAAEVEESNRQLKLGEGPKPVPDIGFRVLRIDSSNMEDTYRTPGETDQMDLPSLAGNVKLDRTPEDLLFEVLPKFRIPYSARIEKRELGGRECFLVDGNRLVACFDTEVGTETIEEMARLEPDYAVMRDASMRDDATQANFEELFKTYSPDTVRRVI